MDRERDKLWCIIHIGDGDGDVLHGRCAHSIGDRHLHLVIVVLIGIGGSFKVRSAVEGHHTRDRVDREQSLVRATADAVGQHTRFGIGRIDINRGRLVFIDGRGSQRTDHRRLVRVGHVDRD